MIMSPTVHLNRQRASAQHIWECGPRSTFEAIREVATRAGLSDQELTAILDRYHKLDPQVLKELDAYHLGHPTLRLVSC